MNAAHSFLQAQQSQPSGSVDARTAALPFIARARGKRTLWVVLAKRTSRRFWPNELTWGFFGQVLF
jgi:hypothetical protein